jgi:hypothetical protein
MPKQSLKQLQRKWERILASEGLYPEPIHSEANKATYRITSDSQMQTRQTQHRGRQEYYRLAGQFLWEHDWRFKLHRAVWSLHADAVPHRHPAAFKRFKRLLKQELGYYPRIKESTTRKLIENLANAMKEFYSVNSHG